MIHEIGVELQARLRTAGVPVNVVDGPELPTTTWGRERIVIEFDADGSDSFVLPRSLPLNARHRYTSSEACKLTIYAQSSERGATVFEHQRRAKKLRDEVLTAMDYVAVRRRNRWKPNSGAFITPPDLEKTERPGGAVYEIRFMFEQAVAVLTMAGAAQPEGNILGIRSTNKVSMSTDESDPNTPPANAETACGA